MGSSQASPVMAVGEKTRIVILGGPQQWTYGSNLATLGRFQVQPVPVHFFQKGIRDIPLTR